MTDLNFDVPDMDCDGCVASIERAVKLVDPAARINANLETKRVVVGSIAHEADMLAAIEQAGYTVRKAA